MTKIKFYKSKDKFVGFEISGHTGYNQYGKDVLCATISGITQSTTLGIRDVCKINANISRDDDSGYLKVELPNNLDKQTFDKVQVLLETLYVSINDLCLGYSKYISMEVIGNVY